MVRASGLHPEKMQAEGPHHNRTGLRKGADSLKTSIYSAKVGYACVALLELAAHHGERQPVRVQAISERHSIPKHFLVQILLQLKGAGLVESTRGSTGGYALARDPKEITLRDVIRLIDRATDDSPTEPEPAASNLMRAITSVWDEVHNAQQQILARTTLADLVTRAHDEAELMYQI